jgi:hypothetical protein
LNVSITGFFLIENPATALLGTAKVAVDDISFMVKIVNGQKGVSAFPPSIWNKTKNDGKGGYEDALTLTPQLRNLINEEVRREYESKSNKRVAPAAVAPIPSSQRIDTDEDPDDDIPF